MVVVTSKNREQVSLLMLQNCRILVATSCAGTGLNPGPLEQVVVVGLPYSVEQLLQWAGRLRQNGDITVVTCSADHWKRLNYQGRMMVMVYHNSSMEFECVWK